MGQLSLEVSSNLGDLQPKRCSTRVGGEGRPGKHAAGEQEQHEPYCVNQGIALVSFCCSHQLEAINQSANKPPPPAQVALRQELTDAGAV